MNNYKVGDSVTCSSFGSVKDFKAKVHEVKDGVPVMFRTRNGTLVSPKEVVSYR